ncbi:hypothetical protein [Gimesia algae]|uniref:Uncharacterized protein n=1 Tax=Gimesia algae TaxID=2527971 RepID=A0A517VAB1_9PLAN|nr:hypothetical protein [Gimesia algae]QDT89947.1 hypothetical protein Pan161_15800 [Gimesia algae]
MARIQDEFLDKSVIDGFPPILNPVDAIALVRSCRTRKAKVLGIDGFHIIDSKMQPDMAESIDYSTNRKIVSDCWTEAEHFLQARIKSELVFEVVVDE